MIWIAAALLTATVIMLYYRRRRLALLVVSVLSLAAIIIWSFASGVSQQQRQERQAVSASIGLAVSCAEPEQALEITLENNSASQVRRVSLTVAASLAGQADIVYRGSVREGVIIEPGSTATLCYKPLYHGFRHPRPDVIDTSLYDWRSEVTVVNFDGDVSN
ncbi:hypothetical protein FE840_019415 (plasmid) [Peteryoungia desertarenae]|uniref:DUF2393 domain-containing protein n=1 Tax=Peteryoungia desertarenae TaxID=1813451 RepID=A0ABX6QTR7_9HYPH|nr:hypothetical protein [Peteryoungia desertarenae]QLF71787.1 hypothetical protein FE840_019415 [Peteryoungia desertarenae]